MQHNTHIDDITVSVESTVEQPRFAEWQDAPNLKIPVQLRWRSILRSYPLWIGLIGLFGALAQLSMPVADKHSTLFVILMLLAFAHPVLDSLSHLTGFANEAPWPVARLLDVPAPKGQFPVTTSCSTEGFSYGSSSGVLTISDGWMNFTSPSINWAVKAESVDVIGFQDSKLTFSFGYFSSGRGYRTVVSLYTSALVDGERLRISKNDFVAAIEEWQRAAPHGASILPPKMPPPTAEKPGLKRNGIIAVGIASVGLSAIGFYEAGFWGILVGLLIPAVAALILLTIITDRAKEDLMRAGLSPTLVKHWTEWKLEDLFRRNKP